MKYLPVPASPFYRWIVFNSVGANGISRKLRCFVLVSIAGLHYLPATALAVEAAVLHNFLWHENWTWADREKVNRNRWFRRIVYFHLANVVSMAGNMLLMRYFVGTLEMHYIPSNLIAIALCAVLNFRQETGWYSDLEGIRFSGG